MNLTPRQLGVLTFSIFIVALCGIAYELIISTVSSYLIGNSVYQFSMTIGLFMFSMGVGSYLSKLFMKDLVSNFVIIEVIISLIGGVCSLVLFLTFPYLFTLYKPVMYLLIFVIGTLVGLEIPILTRILSEYREMRLSIAHVLSMDYVGALVGSMIFPLLLLPQLGLVRSSFAIGLLNISVAIINIYIFRDIFRKKGNYKKLFSFSVAILLLMLTSIFFGSWLTRFAEHHLYLDQVIYQKQSPYQRIVLTQHGLTKEHRLYIDGHIQFSERDEYRYHESLVHPVMALEGERKSVLVLGGGDGLAIREILKWKDVEIIHLVDIDKAITDVCSTVAPIVRLNNDSLSSPKVKLFNEDAFTFINQQGTLYNRVIIDLPDPHNEVLSKLYSREFYKMLSRRLTPNGHIISQSASPFLTRNVFWCIAESMESAGFHTRGFHIALSTFGIWGFQIASRDEVPKLETLEMNHIQTRFISPETLLAAQIFPSDIARVQVPVNSIMEPKIYELYNEALNR